ncbi:uncharacterized protein G2W53_022920 [Senna tora]|uniref:Uncharacterized protein n=1 Tax=Senna tora TaxID=362788 RepID=A0A834TPV3_9FABA|nr:uncharacterized protein G2W53_022920 [Senna tora]
MAAIAILLDLWRKNQGFNPGVSSARISHTFGLFSASAASLAVGSTFASRALFGYELTLSLRILMEAFFFFKFYIIDKTNISLHSPGTGSVFGTFKLVSEYWKILYKYFLYRYGAYTFGYSILLEFIMVLWLSDYISNIQKEDDEDFLQNNQHRVDLIVPLKKSVKQIARESTVMTTRRVLERVAVRYVSQRMAWKLLKDVPQSALRKAGRKMPTLVYFVCVSRTTFRGHMLGVAASWVVQVGIEVYRFLTSVFNPKEEDNNVDKSKRVRSLGQGIFMATFRCSSSLIFASIGAGIGATIFTPSTGQKIGCAAGDFAGPVIVAYCADKIFRLQE